MIRSQFGVGKPGQGAEKSFIIAALHVSWNFYKTILRPGGEPGRARPWKRSGLIQMGTENSTLSDCPASQGVIDPGSKLGTMIQVDHSLLSPFNSLPSALGSMSSGDYDPIQSKDGVIKNKSTREGEPRKRWLMNLSFPTRPLKPA